MLYNQQLYNQLLCNQLLCNRKLYNKFHQHRTVSPETLARQIDHQLTHVWMVRTFLKHSEEGEEDEELQEVFRELYDCMHALGPAADREDWEGYLKLARKKLKKLQNATALFLRIQPQISSHTNFQMAARSLQLAVAEVTRILES